MFNTRTESKSRAGLLSRTAVIVLAAFVSLAVLIVAGVFLATSFFSNSANAKEIVKSLKDKGMPVGEIKAYTARITLSMPDTVREVSRYETHCQA